MEAFIQKHEYYAKAFVSCSLRTEDEPFVDFICSILDAHHIKPYGTVGKFSVSPENPIISMNKNIKDADIVVICATPRYIQQDIHNNDINNGMSEMIHVETGMAIAYGKPVVVFAKEGTNVGNALPNITQYIELTGFEDDYNEKKGKISSLLNEAYKYFRDKLIQKRKESAIAIRDKEKKEILTTIGVAVALVIAVYIIIKFVNNKE